MRVYVGQDQPNYQQQWPGPEPGLGMLPPRRGPKSRDRYRAPMAFNNQLFPQQHVFYYRQDPSGAGPGGQDNHLPEQPRTMGLMQRLKLLLNPPPNGSRLPVAPWGMIVGTTQRQFVRTATGEDKG